MLGMVGITFLPSLTVKKAENIRVLPERNFAILGKMARSMVKIDSSRYRFAHLNHCQVITAFRLILLDPWLSGCYFFLFAIMLF